MCFRFGSCFGSGSGQDYGRSTSKAAHHWADHSYYKGADQQAYHRQPAADERQHNTHNGGGHGGYAAYAQDKADDDTSKHPAAWIRKVGDDAGHTYTARLQEDAFADRREHGAVDHHHYPTTITTTTAR